MHLRDRSSLRASSLKIGLCAALCAACGDGDNTAGSAGDTAGDTDDGTTAGVSSLPTTGTGDPGGSESGTTGATTGGMSGSEGTSGGPQTSTGEITATESGGETTTTTGDETGTPGTTTTTGEDTAADTTTTGADTEDPPPDGCPLADMHLPCDANAGPMDVLQAIGIDCTAKGGDWVDKQNAVKADKYVFKAPAAQNGKASWQVAKSYGTHIDDQTGKPFWSAREGDKVLLISSGLMPMPDGQGVVTVPNGQVYNDVAFGGEWDSNVMPPPMSPLAGSPDPMGFTNCDGMNDCSNTLEEQWTLGAQNPEDKTWFSFELTAPAIAGGDIADANGYTFEFAYFSAEFPEWVGTDYNDIFVVWQASEEYTGNVVFIDEQPLTVTALWPIDFPQNDKHLAGTGFQTDGGATGWYKATGGVTPGETFTLAFAVFDMGDSTYDTTALIDNWLWDCEGCVPNEVNSCGIEPQ